jgi:glycerol kinase
MTSFVLALDQGTTSSRALLFDADGRIQGLEQQEFPQIYPQPGWVEHAPEDLWASQAGVATRLLRNCNVSPDEVAAVGITNQRETTLLWERATGRPVHNAIVWQDRRTASLCERLRAEGHAPTFQARTGLPIDPYFSGTKIRWLLDHVEGLRARAERGEIAFGTVDTFLLWRLTDGAVHATDPTNASRTLLYNIVTQDWDDELLALLDIPRAILPEVKPTSAVRGETSAELFGACIPIAGVAGDQQAATFGQACFRQGMVKNTYGTGCFLLMNTGPSPHLSNCGLLTTVAWDLGGDLTYALEGSVFVAGAAIQWLRDELRIIHTAAETEALAASVPDSGGVVFVPAFTGLGAPYWDPYARGAVLGLTRGTQRAHLARAALEAVCFQTVDLVEAMRSDCGLPIPELRVDGGMTANSLLLQIQADLLGIPVVRPTITETTALGAARLAGLAVGFWQSTDQIAAQWAVDAVSEPHLSADRRAALLQDWRRAVDRIRSR